MRLYEISGTEIKPKSFKQKSPKARAIAKPGELALGSHNRATSGSSRRAKTRPLQRLILSASPIKENYSVCNETFHGKKNNRTN